VEQGKREGSGLAGAGRGHREHILPEEQGRDRGELNRGGFFVAERSQRGEHTRIKSKGGKTGWND
jgi:hypothetical protein